MKGLLIKDFNILLQQKKFMIVLACISIFMLMTTSDPSFVVGYLTMVTTFVAVGTISYDDMDNSCAFLMTLPVSRKEYALEKYILSILVGGTVWGIASVAVMLMGAGATDTGEMLVVLVSLLVFSIVMFSVMIPLQLKFGAEKARTAIFVMFGGGAVLYLLLEQYGGNIPVDVSGILTAIEAMTAGEMATVILLFGVVVMVISALISARVMEKKQFS